MLTSQFSVTEEPMFGRKLEEVCPPSSPRVPDFVVACVKEIESNEDNMCTDGLYRASGNLSQVQKIRLEVRICILSSHLAFRLSSEIGVFRTCKLYPIYKVFWITKTLIYSKQIGETLTERRNFVFHQLPMVYDCEDCHAWSATATQIRYCTFPILIFY